MTTLRHPRTLSLLAVAAATLALGACSQQDDTTIGQKVDAAIATTAQQADAAKAEVKSEMADAKAATERATDQLTRKVESAADQVSSTVSDVAVTASIHAELARDATLSSLKIDVDTSGGRVLLSGKAPSEAARERATVLASGVKGVVSVENRLQVGG
jgi:hyperosmotically inducible periplasmic protein